MIFTLTLIRMQWGEDGIFSDLLDEEGELLATTLEHAYPAPDGHFDPKIPDGAYLCKRGMHRLHGMKEPFETFEITGVVGHTNLLFHAGNFDQDSEGCILVGVRPSPGIIHEIDDSRKTFSELMKKLTGLNEFTLVVE